MTHARKTRALQKTNDLRAYRVPAADCNYAKETERERGERETGKGTAKATAIPTPSAD